MRAAFVSTVSACLCAIACGGSQPEDSAAGVRNINTPGLGQSIPASHPPSGSVTRGDPQAGCARNSQPPASEVWLASVAADDVFELSSVAADVANNVILARYAGETRKIGPGGDTLWSKPFGSLVAVDRAGNVYVTGTSPALGTSSADAGSNDVFVAKLDPMGNLLYASLVGSAPVHGITGLAVDADGSAVVSGKGFGTVKLDAAGHPLWNRSFDGYLAIDSKGNVLMTGGFTDSVDFGGGSLVSAGGEDIFVTKLDPAGNHVFSKRFGDAGANQRGEAIAIDAAGDVLVSGVLDGVVDFGDGPISVPPGACPAEVWCEKAGFVLKLDPQGNSLWSWSRAPIRSLPGIASDSRGNVLVSGAYPGNVEPFRLSFLIELDPAGLERWQLLEWPKTGAGAGHRVAVDSCDNVLWSLSVRPSLDESEQSYLAKLTP
jgi:hypothetical protein